MSRAVALTAATAMSALVAAAASACGGTTTTTGPTTNGLEKKSPADVLQAAAAALESAKSVHVVATSPSGGVDARMQGTSSTGTLTSGDAPIKFTIIGNVGYANTDQAGLKMLGTPPSVQLHDAGRWLKVRAQDFTGLTLAGLASQLTTYRGPLDPKVAQATLHGHMVVVISWRDGAKMWVANAGPAYPLRAELMGQTGGVVDFTEYGAPVHITAPPNAIDLRPL